MEVSNWVSDPPNGSEAAMLPDGSLLVSIGATLSVGPIDENPVGIYAVTIPDYTLPLIPEQTLPAIPEQTRPLFWGKNFSKEGDAVQRSA